ncbi:ubiquitin carboxyl-terminal hydrolase 36 [Periplaneta americana]|uniref:ubiquitin carboxyl-terminal hydrolase 36 n=1 Tax=Periplaneta americana TaxID=6978 RepID=UPI0037E82FB4
MPASGGDPVTAALRLSLTASQGSQDSSNLDKRLIASNARVLLTRIDYEPAGNCLGNAITQLKNKYIVLKSQDAIRNGAETAALSTNSTMPVSSASINYNGTMKPEPDSILPAPKVTLFPAECVQLGWRGTQCVGAGMINVGNTCYLNSTLQALFHVPAFVNWLHSDTNHLSSCTIANGTMNGECIICAMNKTLKASQSKSGTIIKPFLIYNKLKFICKHLVHGQQEDAHEFMRYLLESMEKAYLTRYKGNKLDNYSKETTPLNQIFGGYIRTEVTCLQCGGVSTTFQHCQDLLLDIRRASTLDDALAAYFCKERLDGDDAYRCERCHRKVSATKKFSIEKPPQVLCIQFKRFSILGGKINKHVSFSQRLDLTRFLCPQSAHRGPVPLTYRLVSVVTHVGSSVHCGHYTAVAQTSTGHYYQFDDSLVRPISLAAVLDTNAYIMMYEREPRLQQPKGPSSSQSIPSATATSATVNGQKLGAAVRGQTVQGPTVVPLNHKIGATVNHKTNSMSVTNHKQGSDTNSLTIPPSYATASPLPPAKDRDRVVFGLHQPAASPAPSRLVMHIKNGKVYRSPPQPSPQQQEPSASTAASTAASLVPYCESGEDDSSSSDSEEPPTCLWDMPSLGEVSPSSPHSKPVPVSNKVPSKTNLKRNNSAESVLPLATSSNQISESNCTVVGKSVQAKRSDLNIVNTSSVGDVSSIGDVSVSSGKSNSDAVKIKKTEDVPSQNSVSFVSQDKCKTDIVKTEGHNTSSQGKLSPDRNVTENLKLKRADMGCPSRSRNSSVSPSKNGAEGVDPWRTDVSVPEDKISSPVGSANPKIRQSTDSVTRKENSETVNLHVNTSPATNRWKYNTGWQVTDLLLHSPSVASEGSSSGNSVANSTTDWAVSDVKQKYNPNSRKIKKPTAHKLSCSDSDLHNDVTVNSLKSTLHSEVTLLKDESEFSKNVAWKTYSDIAVSKPESAEYIGNGESETSKYDVRSVHVKKKRKSEEEIRSPSASPKWKKSKDDKDSDTDDPNSKQYNKKREKKLKKLKKHKKREKSTAEESENSESTKDEENGCYEWVEKTHETLGLTTTTPQAETNGHCWDGARKSEVTNHLSHLSHRGYGTANVTSWSGERSHMDEEVERDRKEDRKRSYDNSYNEEFDRGRVKKIKYHQMDSHHNKPKYNVFQDYHNYKHQWGNSNGGSYYHKPYYHNSNKGYNQYNNYHPRNKYAGRNGGYHNGNKYHNRYTKRDRWRH